MLNQINEIEYKTIRINKCAHHICLQPSGRWFLSVYPNLRSKYEKILEERKEN